MKKEEKVFRSEVLFRDGYQCDICTSYDKLEVHHLNSRSYFPSEALMVSNGKTLCKACHFTFFHILFKGGTRKKSMVKDYKKFRALSKYFMKIGMQNTQRLPDVKLRENLTHINFRLKNLVEDDKINNVTLYLYAYCKHRGLDIRKGELVLITEHDKGSGFFIAYKDKNKKFHYGDNKLYKLSSKKLTLLKDFNVK